jgi:hypothetical protein
MKNYWNVFAHNYRLLGAPLKPAPEDVAVVEDTLAHWRTAPPRVQRLLCGVLPADPEVSAPPIAGVEHRSR